MTANSEPTFLPAAGHDYFLPVYDPLTSILGVNRARRALLDQAGLRAYHRVLDVGCGTGTLAIAIKRDYPSVDVIALDPDPKALARAERKAFRARVSIRFDQGFADRLTYRDETFDRVFSSLMFHHLEHDDKEKALSEIRRVLKPGGRLEFLDFDGSNVNRRLKDNAEQQILKLLERAGLVNATRTGRKTSLIGRLAFYQASAPAR
jgi:ubiquinone/menaquinone biosynthesis C-methylase UbiE